MTSRFPPTIAIVGPTAVGKSGLALQLARELGAEIVSADSRQVYRYMDIGTDKPSLADQAEIRHYMLNLIDPSETYSVRRYRDEARPVLYRIDKSGKPTLVVGGTGFYLRALLDGLSPPSVPPNLKLRAQLRQVAEEQGVEVLHQRLSQLDPASAERVHPHNLHRLIRSLEIVEGLRAPVPPVTREFEVPTLWLGLSVDRSELFRRADRRVDRQVEAGLIMETEQLLAMGFEPDSPGLRGFGYRQMVAYLSGLSSLVEAIEKYKTATRQYIRRQLTWFRPDDRIQWLDAEEPFATAREKALSWLAACGYSP